MNKKIEDWVVIGYEVCSIEGFNSLKIESISKQVGISKSSFYHHFGDLEGFVESLFEYHFARCVLISHKEKNCERIHPDLINIIVEHKTDFLFNRQLRINKNNDRVKQALVKSNQLLGNYAVMLWAREINANLSTAQLESLFKIATDDFYMQINENNLTHDFLASYFKNLSQISHSLNAHCTPPSKMP